MRRAVILILMLALFVNSGLAQNPPVNEIKVTPHNAELMVGDSLYFNAVYFDSSGNKVDTTFEWSLAPDSVGALEGNFFTALKPGEAEIQARLDTIVGIAEIEVEEIDDDEDGDEIVQSIEIRPERDDLTVDDSVEYYIQYTASNGTVIDTTAEFTFTPDTLAHFEDNMLIAEAAGEGLIAASFGTLVDTLEVEIESDEDDDDEEDKEKIPRIRISPRHEDITLGDTVEYRITYIDTSEVETDTTATWLVEPDTLGSFVEGDSFVAENEGEGKIFAQLDTLIDSLEIEIEAEEHEEEYEKPRIIIYPRRKWISVGDSIEYKVVYKDSGEVSIDTTAELKFEPDSLGGFINNNVFVAGKEGQGIITAKLDTLTDSLRINIGEREDWRERYRLHNRLTLFPKDTIVSVGSTVEYRVKFNKDGYSVDTTAEEWEMEGMEIGTLENGVLTTSSPGFALIRAKIGDNIGTAFIIVEDSEDDTTDNTISISRPHMNPMKEYKIIKEVTEGGIWRIGGFPHPLNVFNGGFIYFPKGSLKEDIRIHVSVPKFANIRTDTVEFSRRDILTSISFEVYVGDSLVEPYEFETPLIVGLVYKRGLLRKLNIDPETLGLYYVESKEEGLEFDSTGINSTTLAYYRNLIFSNVEHFSTLAIKGQSETTDLQPAEKTVKLPQAIQLHQNYPNPFNPVTNIEYNIPSKMKVSLEVYNVLGQKVSTLVNGERKAGYHQIQWNANQLPSGIYLIRLKADKKVSVKRALLIK